METIEYKNCKIEINCDDCAESPREWDTLGTMICFHKRYDLGDKHDLRSEDFNNWEEIKNHVEKEYNPLIILPLFLYDHSGISIKTFRHGYHSSWDCGQVGYIFISKEKVKEEFTVKRITKALKEKIENLLIGEVETYNDYVTGNVYYFSCLDDEKTIDSCGGFYGYDHEKSGLLEYAREAIDNYLEDKKEGYNQFKALIA